MAVSKKKVEEVKKVVLKKKVVKKVPSIVAMVERMKASIEAMAKDCEKFDGGVSSAGGRVRKGMQEIKVHCKEIRDAITDIKNGRKES